SICEFFLSSFFFSSRRRHTRFSRDWSSDVCSSDLDRIVHNDLILPIKTQVESLAYRPEVNRPCPFLRERSLQLYLIRERPSAARCTDLKPTYESYRHEASTDGK